MFKLLVGVLCTGLLVACGQTHFVKKLNIANVFAVGSTFGPDFHVHSSGPTRIDPKQLSQQPLPGDVTFDPSECREYASGQTLPRGLAGAMAIVSAEGEGNRFIAIALEASEPVSLDPTITQKCQHVTFSGENVKGTADVVDAPNIRGAQTLGTHRTLETTTATATRSGEIYDFIAYLGNYVVMVTATPRMARGQPSAAVNVDRAKSLLTDAVAAIRSR
jgi:Domain of unknown function (DUF5642)